MAHIVSVVGDTVDQSVLQFEEVLRLQELDTDLYMALKTWKSVYARGTFGGYTICQALLAASKTVPTGFNLHSMHSYFLRSGDPSRSTIYRVLRTRDGQRFSSRTVSAIQDGKPILTLQASFHCEEAEASSILEYQPKFPDVKHHQKLLTVEDHVRDALTRDNLSVRLKDLLKRSCDVPIVIKPLDPKTYFSLSSNPDHSNSCWVKVSANLGDDQHVNRCAAAFVSDWSLLYSSLKSNHRARPTMMASLDHSMWFHRPFRIDDWLLYESAAVQMHNSRSLCHGRLWTEDGKLVATVAQEGVIRGKL